jgi:hypothetical protein
MHQSQSEINCDRQAQVHNDADFCAWGCKDEAHPSLVFKAALLGSMWKVRCKPSRIDISYVIVLRHSALLMQLPKKM